MKVFAGGPQDIADAANALKAAADSLDLVLLRRLAERFGRATAHSLERLLENTSTQALSKSRPTPYGNGTETFRCARATFGIQKIYVESGETGFQRLQVPNVNDAARGARSPLRIILEHPIFARRTVRPFPSLGPGS